MRHGALTDVRATDTPLNGAANQLTAKLNLSGHKCYSQNRAGVAELVDAQDLKSCVLRDVRVRFPSPVPLREPPETCRLPDFVHLFCRK